jgi:hypothetical protein
MTPLRSPIPLGRTLATPGALAAMERSGDVPVDFLRRHECQDWGNVDPEDWARNDEALKDGSRIISSYRLKDGETVWCITEADRAATTLLLPDEY